MLPTWIEWCMARSDEPNDKDARLERIREVVRDDYERIRLANSPYQILNVVDGESLEQIEDRYNRYERFYRAENFQRLGDIDLTRKALDIRRAIGRAIVEVRRSGPRGGSNRVSRTHDTSIFEDSHDRHALAEIYLNDGLTYLQLGELTEAGRFFRLSVDYDEMRAISLAYLGYVIQKQRSFDSSAVEEARDYLDRAAKLDPEDPDVFILRGRFFAKLQDVDNLAQTIVDIERIDPAHPTLDRLQRKLNRLKG